MLEVIGEEERSNLEYVVRAVGLSVDENDAQTAALTTIGEVQNEGEMGEDENGLSQEDNQAEQRCDEEDNDHMLSASVVSAVSYNKNESDKMLLQGQTSYRSSKGSSKSGRSALQSSTAGGEVLKFVREGR